MNLMTNEQPACSRLSSAMARPPAPDSLSQRGAMNLARRLEQYWHDRGYVAARFWTEPLSERFPKVGTYELYRVACNLIGGLPPRYREQTLH